MKQFKGKLKLLKRTLKSRRYRYDYRDTQIYFAKFGKDWYIDFTFLEHEAGKSYAREYSFRFKKLSTVCGMVKNIRRIIDIIADNEPCYAKLVASPACRLAGSFSC